MNILGSTVIRQLAIVYFGGLFVALLAGGILPLVAPLKASPILPSASAFVTGAIIATMIVGATGAALGHARSWIWILAGALLVRLAIAWLNWDVPMQVSSDSAAYRSIAHSLVEGGGLALRSEASIGFAMFPPGYSLALALPMALGVPDCLATYLVNGVADLAAAWAVRAIAIELNAPTRANLAASLYLLWPPSISGFPLSLKEGLAVMLTLNIMLAFLRCHKVMTIKEAVRLGLGTGALALTLPAWIALTPMLGIAYLMSRGPVATAKLALFSIPFALLVLGPWWVRNFIVFDRFVPLTTGAWLNLYFVVTNSYDKVDNLVHNGGAN